MNAIVPSDLDRLLLYLLAETVGGVTSILLNEAVVPDIDLKLGDLTNLIATSLRFDE